MSSLQVNNKFSEFGRRMNTIAILTLLSFIMGIVGVFIPIVGFIALGLGLIIIIFFLILFGNIKRAGRELNNNDLLAYVPRFLWGTIIRFIGQVVLSIAWIFISSLILFIILLSIGVSLIIVGSVFRYKAWGGLETFFITNSQLFPQKFSYDGRSGAKTCKIASIFDMTIILSIIGEIIRVFGYFKLARLRYLNRTRTQIMQKTPAPPPTSMATPSINYCPNCGSTLTSGDRFCPECGSETS